MSKQEIGYREGINIMTLRRHFKMTAAEFADSWLTDGEGERVVSPEELKRIEAGELGAEKVLAHLEHTLSMDPSMFDMDPDSFAKNIDYFTEDVSKKPERFSSFAVSDRDSTINANLRILSDYLANNIIKGTFKAGSKLPSDRTLSEILDLPRASVRDALKVLDALGVIHIKPGSGSYIASEMDDIFTFPFSWTFLLDDSINDEIFELREILEVKAVKDVCRNRDHPDFPKIAEVIAQEKDSFSRYDFSSFVEYDNRFHYFIAKCSGNKLLCSLLVTSKKILALANTLNGMSNVHKMTAIHHEHMAIAEALQAGDSKGAAEAMKKHLKYSRIRYAK